MMYNSLQVLLYKSNKLYCNLNIQELNLYIDIHHKERGIQLGVQFLKNNQLHMQYIG